VLTPSDTSDFAANWIAAWNAHDLERVLAHYREDVKFTSPFAVTLEGIPDGTLHGVAELRRYFQGGLRAFPDLRFEPIATFAGVSSLALHYRSVAGRDAIEVVELDQDGRVYRSTAHYAPSTNPHQKEAA
jgi:ketosteroid isomerase-like protein